MSFARRYAVAVAIVACTAGLLFGTGCSSCYVKPQTGESKGPALTLSVVDLTTPSENPTYKDIKPETLTALPAESNYQYLLLIIATDPGGLSSLSYSEVFNTGCPCNPNSGACPGSFASGGGPIPPNPDGTVPNEQFEIISVSASQEKTAVGCPASQPTVAGTYTVKATATNPSGKKREATWLLAINNGGTVPAAPKSGH